MSAASTDDFVRYCCGDPDCPNDCEREQPPASSAATVHATTCAIEAIGFCTCGRSAARTVREGLYAGTRGDLQEIGPVPGTPIGDAHLALDQLEAENRRLREALTYYAEGRYPDGGETANA